MFFIFTAPASVFYVDVNSTNPVPPYMNWSTASTDIQSAIDVSTNGDQIWVNDGVYQTGGRVVYDSLTNRVVINKTVTVQSVDGPAFTIIQGNQPIGSNAIRCVFMASNAILSGFTLTNGGTLNTGVQLQDESGGGVWAADGNEIITNCVLIGNVANSGGGGVNSGSVNNCSIIQNSAYGGGAVTGSTVTNSLILSNSASAYGGGADTATLYNCRIIQNVGGFGGGAANCWLYGCLVVGNSATSEGGGIFMGYSVINCTIVGNNAFTGSGGFEEAGMPVANNIIYFNTVTYGINSNYDGIGSLNNCCTIPLKNAYGCITNDPGFVDYANGNFQLQSNSPCINGGANGYVKTSTDLAGNPRIVDGFVDIGAYENQTSVLVLPYFFAQQYGLSLDGSIDSDGDGMNNWQEAIAGTNPTNAASVLKMLSVSQNSSGLTVTWQSVNTRTYYLQRSISLSAQPGFTTIQSNLFGVPIPNMTIYTDTTATNGGPYFYRVGVQGNGEP